MIGAVWSTQALPQRGLTAWEQSRSPFADSLSVVTKITGPNENLDVDVKLDGLDGRYTREAAGVLVNLLAKRLAYTIVQKDSVIDSTQVSDGTDIDIAAELTIPEGLDLLSLQGPADFFAAARNGLGLLVDVTQGPSTGSLSDANPVLPMSISFSAGPARTGLEMNEDVFAVDTQVATMSANLLPPMVPVEAPISMDEVVMSFGMPVVATEPSDYVWR